MFPLGVVGGLQEITSVELSGEFVCKSLTGPDTAEYAVKCYITLFVYSLVSSVVKSITLLTTLLNLFLDWTWK